MSNHYLTFADQESKIFIGFGKQLIEINQLQNYEIPEISLKSNFTSL